MGRIMFVVEHSNYDSQKSTNFRYKNFNQYTKISFSYLNTKSNYYPCLQIPPLNSPQHHSKPPYEVAEG